jgi:hypothetical protein
MKKIILLIILTCGFNLIYSQWSVRLYKVRDVIPFNSNNDQITVMEMDNQGNIWFNLENGTEGAGLGKFTGKKWIVFNQGTDLIYKELGLHVNAFAFEGEENVWIGTDNGLALFDGISPTGWTIYNSGNSDIPNSRITAITVDNKGIKWIGCENGMILAFDGTKWNPLDKYSGTKINDLEADIDGNLWIARNGKPGLVKFISYVDLIEFGELSDIRDVMIDDKGLVYAVSKDRLIVIENDKIVETINPDPRLECELYEVEFHPEGPFVSSNKGILQKIGSGFRLISRDNSSLPELVPKDNFKNVPLLWDRADGLWFSFIYQGNTGINYASLGHMVRTVFQPLPKPVPINKPSLRFCFGESLILDFNVPDADFIVWNDVGTIDRTITVFDTRTIKYSVVFKEECLKDTLGTCVETDQETSQTDSIDVIAQHVFEDEEPCVATVSPDYKNLVAWEKTPYKGTASYNIFREIDPNFPDSFEFIANIPVGHWSYYKDNMSDPRWRSYKYKISSLDTCGNESGPSMFFKTLHLQLSTDIDTTYFTLTWQKYIGKDFTHYVIFKGTSPGNLNPVDSIPWDAADLTWTDYDNSEQYYYGIGVRLPGICAPTLGEGLKADSGPYSHSMSNIEDNRFQTSIKEENVREIMTYPNPFTEWTHIYFKNPDRNNYQLTVTDMSGKIVRTIDNITDNKVLLLRENLPQGFYLFELKGDQVYRGKFVVK